MPNANIPPIKGQYAYYDSRMSNHHNDTIMTGEPHWLIKTADNSSEYGCHYSLPNKMPYEPFVTCHGIITEVGQCIKNNLIQKSI